ncbi:hypothetical protein [Mesorhizobium sp. M1E.F.Ca.ET.063.01.1.1]|uniref:hypothetical protein n=1 Tax=Mesorhizobium sp. M1E.F.Ca.ET.063.01.1.1 TaxID=2496750 RepID=UPI000FCA7481|nr:hypothetical protein [Mesorhizobium sp. M1E.F.Ca.ET.063.01.1.1]RUW85196.1 hypothetical protein EOA29_05945 [Mesorhizobium sp. M1E.F.Ca.ET.063.01.1.1]
MSPVTTQSVIIGVQYHYTNVPRAPLITAINTVAVPAAMRAYPWWENPLGWSGRLVEGTGRRTDLERLR